jgi:DNA-directed RNA polymerase specialized sigma24 family protein/tRNA A-37 threonylcarbamoyl transferase component Bud32
MTSSDSRQTLFATTRWTLVREAARVGDPCAVEALGALFATYWQPLYRYARRKGKPVEDAEDLVQGFLAHLLATGGLRETDRNKGRFRAFLLASFNHWMINEWRHASREKRGGGISPLSFDWESAETGLSIDAPDERSPDKLYDREWALALLGKVLADLETLSCEEGNAAQFQKLKPCLTEDSAKIPYADIPCSLTCPDCGAPLPADSPQALCPACLMRQALASRTILPEGGKPNTTPPPSPEEIADKFPAFEILECLGRGGMGVVYKARQKSLNRLVAIKILAPEREHDARFAERFAREAEMLAQLNHPHIVTIHDFGETGGLFYLVMEFVDGVNLRDLLREGKLDPEQALAIVPPICDALQYAHDKGIVHRDIKPENLLLDLDGRIKIADFGIAALIGDGAETIGTPPYMAPEQCGASSEVDSRADIYALGVVLYKMLTGERPAKDLVPPSRKVSIDVRLDEMVLRALEKSPELRYQTAGEFRTVVETMAAPVSASVPEASNGAKRKKRRKKVVFSLPDPLPSKGALLGIAAALIVLGVLLFMFGPESWDLIRGLVHVIRRSL